MDDYGTLWVIIFDYWIEFVWEDESYGDHEISAGEFLNWSEQIGIKYPLVIRQVFEESGEWINDEVSAYIIKNGDLPEEMKDHQWIKIKETKTAWDFKELIKILYP